MHPLMLLLLMMLLMMMEIQLWYDEPKTIGLFPISLFQFAPCNTRSG
jgi:hypothetical protein